MTLTQQRAVPPSVSDATTLATLARYETLRLARHPIFVVAALLFLVLAATTPFSEYATEESFARTGDTEGNLDWPVAPAFFLGLGGLIAMNRLTTSSGRAGDVLRATPVSEQRRTLALCLACLLPAAIALLGAAYVFTWWMVEPPTVSIGWHDATTVEKAATMAQGVLAALGGSLLGVLVARWWRWPTAAAVTALVLIVWASLAFYPDRSPLLRLNHMASPFSLLSTTTVTESWVFGGNQVWRTGYLAGLCALAALGACAHGTEGAPRRRMVRLVAVVGALTLTALLLSVVLGPDGQPGFWDPRWDLR